MKEVTIITTCEITHIYRGRELETLPTEELNRKMAKLIKEDMKADDVVVLNRQVFVRDDTDTEQQKDSNPTE